MQCIRSCSWCADRIRLSSCIEDRDQPLWKTSRWSHTQWLRSKVLRRKTTLQQFREANSVGYTSFQWGNYSTHWHYHQHTLFRCHCPRCRCEPKLVQSYRTGESLWKLPLDGVLHFLLSIESGKVTPDSDKYGAQECESQQKISSVTLDWAVQIQICPAKPTLGSVWSNRSCYERGSGVSFTHWTRPTANKMDTVQKNVLRQKICDAVHWLNSRSDTDVLNSIRRRFTALDPLIPRAIQKRLGGNDSISADASKSPDLPQTPKPSLLTAESKTEDEAGRVQKEEQQRWDYDRGEQEMQLEFQTALDGVLSDLCIKCTNSSFIEFASAKWNSNHKRRNVASQHAHELWRRGSLRSLYFRWANAQSGFLLFHNADRNVVCNSVWYLQRKRLQSPLRPPWDTVRHIHN